jgi:hypothetical protein
MLPKISVTIANYLNRQLLGATKPICPKTGVFEDNRGGTPAAHLPVST